MTDDLVARLRDRLAKATPGPWFSKRVRGHNFSEVWAGTKAICSDGFGDDDDADLICDLRNNAPALLYEIERLRAENARLREGGWQPIETAPKDCNILVWYDHDADPYTDPTNPNKLTPYAAWAEGGDFLDGRGYCIAKWFPKHFESEDEYGNGFWMPACWFAFEDNDWARAVNPIHWQPLPTPPATGKEG